MGSIHPHLSADHRTHEPGSCLRVMTLLFPFLSSSCRLLFKCHLLWKAFPDHSYMSNPLLPLSYILHQALFFFITFIAIWDDTMLCCLSLPSEQNGQEIRISIFPSPYSLYLFKCPAYSRHSIIIWGRNAYIMHVKIHGKVQSCTVDRKITHYQLCLPTVMKRGFARRFGNFLKTGRQVSNLQVASIWGKKSQRISKSKNWISHALNTMPNSCEWSGG